MRYLIAAIALAFTAASFPSTAQEPADHTIEAPEHSAFRELMEAEADELSIRNPKDSDIIDLVEKIMTVRLARRLGLTIEETQDLGNSVGDCRDRVYDLKWLRAEKRQALRKAIEVGDKKTIERELDKLLRLEGTIAHLIQKMIRDSQNELTLEQSAEFYLFIEDFESEISETIQHARELNEARNAQAAETDSESK